MSLAAKTFRRLEKIPFEGTYVESFLDESGQLVWVCLRSLIDAIGVKYEPEVHKFKEDVHLYRSLNIQRIGAYDDTGDRGERLFLPLSRVNHYLWSIKDIDLRGEIYGNLESFKEGFVVEADRHWSRLTDATSTANPLSLRLAVYSHTLYELRRTLSTASSYREIEGEEAERFEEQALLRAIRFCQAVTGIPNGIIPVSSMKASQLELYTLLMGRYKDLVAFHMDVGVNGKDLFKLSEKALQDASANIRKVTLLVNEK